MDNRNAKSIRQKSNHPWLLHYTFGLGIAAHKRYRRAVYALRADDRHTVDILISNRLQTLGSSQSAEQSYNFPSHLMSWGEYQAHLRHRRLIMPSRPWWMSISRYTAMLFRLGIPF